MTNKALFHTAASSTFRAGVLHHAIVPIFFTPMPVYLTIFFKVSDLAQLFWVIPVIKRWSEQWYCVEIVGTVVFIIV